MTISDICTKARFLTNATTSTYSNTDILYNINNWYEKVVIHILKSHDEWEYDDTNNSDYPILTTNLVANQQDYTLPSGAIRIQRVEWSPDGTNWYKLEPFDLGERGVATNTTLIQSDFSVSSPMYDTRYNSLFLYPIPTTNVSGGLRIWITRNITEFTSGDISTGTKTPGFDVPFHSILAYGAAYDYAMAKNLPNTEVIKGELVERLAELENFYGDKVEDRILFLRPAYVDYGRTARSYGSHSGSSWF